MAYWWISLIVAVVCSMVAAYIASNKGRSVAGYAILGFFLPVIGLIIALVVPSRR
jgi:hypothetical protein